MLPHINLYIVNYTYICHKSINREISRIRIDVFVEECGFCLQEEFDDNEKDFLHCCLYENNIFVAYARIKVNLKTARIGRVLVLKDRRNKGLGRQILLYAEKEIFKRNIYLAEVHALDQAVGFYEKLGYVKDGDWFIEDGRNHIRMIKRLEVI